jgi:hypothetical protein
VSKLIFAFAGRIIYFRAMAPPQKATASIAAIVLEAVHNMSPAAEEGEGEKEESRDILTVVVPDHRKEPEGDRADCNGKT